MKEYKIKTGTAHNDYFTMIIINRETGEEIAEYRLTLGEEKREIAAMRRALDKHLSQPGVTLGHYQF